MSHDRDISATKNILSA
ncbi:hypothetical protein [Lactiplantibacillus pentosus]